MAKLGPAPPMLQHVGIGSHPKQKAELQRPVLAADPVHPAVVVLITAPILAEASGHGGYEQMHEESEGGR
ncbi:hypothetical protein KIP45_10255 [Xanthomonas campestris pv. raphani]|nr:hypothetical protein [Xanthomonas campestris]MCF8826452.1 hypothetical protein [Xanthomonas campestris pv. raphani]WDJ20111.1 hypothetical protein JH264_10790 [Xanthomonas campestris pv. raphani]